MLGTTIISSPPTAHRANAVSQTPTIQIEPVMKEAMDTFKAYSEMDNDPSFDLDPLPHVFQGLDGEQRTVRALLADTLNGYEVRLQVVDGEGSGTRMYYRWDYDFDQQAVGRLKSFNGARFEVGPGTAVGRSFTTEHPVARAAGGDQKNQYRDRQDQVRTSPSAVAVMALDGATAAQEAAQFDQAFEEQWQLAHEVERPVEVDEDLLTELAAQEEIDEATLDLLIDGILDQRAPAGR